MSDHGWDCLLAMVLLVALFFPRIRIEWRRTDGR